MTDDGGPAFPGQQHIEADGKWNQTWEPGMSIRDFFAAAALAGMTAATDRDGPYEKYAEDAWKFADSMLLQRTKRYGTPIDATRDGPEPYGPQF